MQLINRNIGKEWNIDANPTITDTGVITVNTDEKSRVKQLEMC